MKFWLGLSRLMLGLSTWLSGLCLGAVICEGSLILRLSAGLVSTGCAATYISITEHLNLVDVD